MPSSRSLILEVWLGPLEGLRSTAEDEASPQILRIARLPIDRETREKNHLVLGAAAGVSGNRHAEVRLEGGRILVSDLGSANGTFAQQKAVTAPTELRPGEVFFVSLTPVQVTLGPAVPTPPPFEPVPVSVWDDAALQGVLALAADAAARRSERFVDTRHLCEALLRTADTTLEGVFRAAGWSRAAALEELWSKAVYTEAWISDVLMKPMSISPAIHGPVVSPRVSRLLDGARAAVSGASLSERTPSIDRNLLFGLIGETTGPVKDWLVARGLAPRLPSRVESTAAGVFSVDETTPSGPLLDEPPATRAHASLRRPAAPPPPPEPPKSRTFVPVETAVAPVAPAAPVLPAKTEAGAPRAAGRGPAEVALGLRARELASELFILAGEHRFDSGEDRRRLLKARVGKELAVLPREARPKLLDALREEFPLLGPGPRVDDELTRLRRRVAELERKKEPDPGKKSGVRPAGSAFTVRQVVSGEDPAGLDRNVKVLRLILEFAKSMEDMTLGIVQSLTMPGNETVQFRLPEFRETLRTLLLDLEQGKPVNLARAEAYFEALKQWQIAYLAAFHRAPADWFERLWRKINPASIESSPRSAGWKLRGEQADWWELYSQGVKDLSPDVVNDQVLQTVARIAREEVEKLRKSNEK